MPQPAARFTLREGFDAFLADRELRRLSARTLGFYRERTRDFLAQFGPRATVTKEDLRAFLHRNSTRTRAADGRPLSPHTLRDTAVALKVFFRFLAQEGYLEPNPAAAIPLPRLPKREPQVLSEEEVQRLLAVPDKRAFAGFRDYAMLVTMLDCGVRVSELLGLTLSDLDLDRQELLVRSGKGNKDRVVCFGLSCRQTLRLYLSRRREVECPALFVNSLGQPLRVSTLEHALRRYARKAGIQRVTCHTLRRTMASMWVARGGGVWELSKVLGHADLTMLKHYVGVTAEQLREAHRRFSPLDNIAAASPARRRL